MYIPRNGQRVGYWENLVLETDGLKLERRRGKFYICVHNNELEITREQLGLLAKFILSLLNLL